MSDMSLHNLEAQIEKYLWKFELNLKWLKLKLLIVWVNYVFIHHQILYWFNLCLLCFLLSFWLEPFLALYRTSLWLLGFRFCACCLRICSFGLGLFGLISWRILIRFIPHLLVLRNRVPLAEVWYRPTLFQAHQVSLRPQGLSSSASFHPSASIWYPFAYFSFWPIVDILDSFPIFAIFYSHELILPLTVKDLSWRKRDHIGIKSIPPINRWGLCKAFWGQTIRNSTRAKASLLPKLDLQRV